LGPPIAGDRPEARRTLLALTGAVVAIVVAAAFFTVAGRQLMRDVSELARSATRFEPRALDVLSALLVVAPLALAAPGLAGMAGASFGRDPRASWIGVGALPLLIGLV